MWQIIFLKAAELCFGDIGFFGASSELFPSHWTAAGAFTLSLCVPCECTGCSVNSLECCGEMGFLKSSYFCRTSGVYPTFAKLQPMKAAFSAFCVTPPHPLHSCRNLIFRHLFCLYSSLNHPISLLNTLPINIHHRASPSKASFSLPALSSLGKDEVNQLFSWSQRLPGCSGRQIAPLPFLSNAEQS